MSLLSPFAKLRRNSISAVLLILLTTIVISCTSPAKAPLIITQPMTAEPSFTSTPTVTASPTLTKTLTPTPTTTETPTLEPTATPEPLGGSEVAYVWYSWNHALKSLPEGVTNILSSPSNPEIWQQPTYLFYTDGTPLSWGTSFFDIFNQNKTVDLPVLVRGVVEIPNPIVYSGKTYIGGTLIFPVFEVPAQRGSNFIIPLMMDNKWSTQGSYTINYITNGIPLTWESNLDRPVDSTEFFAGIKFTGWYNGRDTADVLKQYVDRIIIASFEINGDYPSTVCLKQVVQGKLINQGMLSTDDFIALARIILPNK